MIRDRDRAYGNEFSRRVRDLGIRSIKTAIRAPKMNCYAALAHRNSLVEAGSVPSLAPLRFWRSTTCEKSLPPGFLPSLLPPGRGVLEMKVGRDLRARPEGGRSPKRRSR